MSKSKLTGIAPSQIVDVFGSDAFRYYFLRAIQFGQDGSFSWEDLSARYKAELANRLGNLASRLDRDGRPLLRRRAAGCRSTSRGSRRPQRRPWPTPRPPSTASTCRARSSPRWTSSGVVNSYVTETGAVAGRQGRVAGGRPRPILYTTAEALRVVAVLLNPVMPKASTRAVGLPRRDADAGLAGRPAGAGRRPLGPAPRWRNGRQGRAAVPAHRGTRAGVTEGPTRARGGPAKGARERPPAPEPLPHPGRRQPLPPRHRRSARRLARRSTRRWPRRRRSASRASCRSAATCPARAGRSRRRGGTTRWWPASRCTPTRRRGSRRAGDLDDGAGRDRRARRRPGRSRGGRDRARLLPDRRGRPRRPGGVVPARTSTWPSGSTRRWSSTTATPTTTCCGSCDGRRPARPRRVPLLLRRRRDGRALRPSGAGGCPSPAR